MDIKYVKVGHKVFVGGRKGVVKSINRGWIEVSFGRGTTPGKYRAADIQRLVDEPKRSKIDKAKAVTKADEEDAPLSLDEFKRLFPIGCTLKHGPLKGAKIVEVESLNHVLLSEADAGNSRPIRSDVYTVCQDYHHNFVIGDYVRWSDVPGSEQLVYEVLYLDGADYLTLARADGGDEGAEIDVEATQVGMYDLEKDGPPKGPAKPLGTVVQIPPRAVRTGLDMVVIKSILKEVVRVGRDAKVNRNKAIQDTLFNLCVTKEEFDFFYALLDYQCLLNSDLETWVMEGD